MLSMVNTICRKLMLFKNLVWVTRYFQNKRGLFYYYSFVSVVHIVPYKIESSDYVITSKTCLGDTYFKERKKKKKVRHLLRKTNTRSCLQDIRCRRLWTLHGFEVYIGIKINSLRFKASYQ